MKSFDISIIIPTYNRIELLEKTIISLKNQKIKNFSFEVLICDDGSKDRPYELIKQYSKKMEIKYFYQEDKGFRAGSARNIGIKNSRGKILLFLDTGVILEENCLYEHLKLHRSSDEPIAILGYMYGFDELNENEKKMIELDIRPDCVQSGIKKLENEKIYDRREKILKLNGDDLTKWKAPWIIFWTGHLSLSRDECLKLGGFDENFSGWGYEDIDLGIRWYLNGNKIIMSRSALSIHLPHKKFKSIIPEENRKAYSNKRKNILIKKYGLDSLKLWLEHDTEEIEGLLTEESNG